MKDFVCLWVCEVCEMWWTTFSLMTMRRTPWSIANVRSEDCKKYTKSWRYHGISTWCVRSGLQWSTSTCFRFVDCNHDCAISGCMHWWHRRGLQLWFGEGGRGRSAEQSISRSVNSLLVAQLSKTSHFCLFPWFDFHHSNMFDSCSKLVAHVFCCDLSCLYSRSCAQTLGRRRCVVAQISASHRGMSSIGWRFARIPKQTHSYLTYLMNSLETSGWGDVCMETFHRYEVWEIWMHWSNHIQSDVLRDELSQIIEEVSNLGIRFAICLIVCQGNQIWILDFFLMENTKWHIWNIYEVIYKEWIKSVESREDSKIQRFTQISEANSSFFTGFFAKMNIFRFFFREKSPLRRWSKIFRSASQRFPKCSRWRWRPILRPFPNALIR